MAYDEYGNWVDDELPEEEVIDEWGNPSLGGAPATTPPLESAGGPALDGGPVIEPEGIAPTDDYAQIIPEGSLPPISEIETGQVEATGTSAMTAAQAGEQLQAEMLAAQQANPENWNEAGNYIGQGTIINTPNAEFSGTVGPDNMTAEQWQQWLTTNAPNATAEGLNPISLNDMPPTNPDLMESLAEEDIEEFINPSITGDPSAVPAPTSDTGPALDGGPLVEPSDSLVDLPPIEAVNDLGDESQSGTDWTPPPTGDDYGVGQDDFSDAITSAIGNTLTSGGAPQGATASSLEAAIQSLLASGGQLGGETDAQRAGRFESLRQPIDMARNAQMDEIEAYLADRGMLGSGEQMQAMGRLEGKLAPMWATALQESGTALDRAQGQEGVQRLGQAFGAGSNLLNQQGTNLSNAMNAGNQRQAMLGDLAIRNLDQNRMWNEFLAEFGLNRDMALSAMQSGQTAQLLQLFQAYLQLAGQSAQGGIM